MDVLSSATGAQLQSVQKALSIAVLDMAMNSQATLATEMVNQMTDMAQGMPVSPGDTGLT